MWARRGACAARVEPGCDEGPRRRTACAHVEGERALTLRSADARRTLTASLHGEHGAEPDVWGRQARAEPEGRARAGVGQQEMHGSLLGPEERPGFTLLAQDA